MARRVLLIDDDEDEFVLLQALFAELKGGPFVLEWRGSYETGLEAALACEHDCYLVDYQLGARTGIELIRAATEGGCTKPLILLTGRSDEVDIEALRAGAADYVSKRELTPALLQRTLLYAIERSQAALTRRELEATQRTKELQQQILGIVGHDLRGPLAAVNATLAALKRHHEMPESLKPRLDRALSGCGRMERIIRDLTDYTQARIGQRLKIAPEPTNIHHLCEEILGDLAAAHPERTIEYRNDGDAQGVWDPIRLTQVLQNLLGNAIKYGREDRPVRLSWRRDSSAGRPDDLVIEVHNEGPPISPDFMPHLFEPFRRGQGADGASRRESLGLGLFIVKQIVATHGGGISVSSTAAEGTTFTVRLPRAPPEPAPPPSPAPPAP